MGLLIGGQVVERWNHAYPDGGIGGIVGWQAAYFAVGLPGILLALWVRTLREPVRGAVDGILTPREPHPFRQFGLELLSVLPPFTPWHMGRPGVDGRYLARNLVAAATIATMAGGLVVLTANPLQWVSLGIGLYVSVCWIQSLGLRDRPAAALIFGTPSLRWVCLGFSLLAFSGYSFAGWTPSFFMRVHEQSAGQVGNVIGLTTALAGLVGVTGGGALADAFRRRATAGRLYLAMLIAVLPVPLALWMLTTEDVGTAYIINVPLTVFSSAWIGAGASTVQDLVLPRMRAIASAFYILVITFVGLALGPYMVGQLSDIFGNLALALRFALVANVLAVVVLLLARRHLARDEETLLDRARAAGEPGLG
jgi:hypothetical protein